MQQHEYIHACTPTCLHDYHDSCDDHRNCDDESAAAAADDDDDDGDDAGDDDDNDGNDYNLRDACRSEVSAAIGCKVKWVDQGRPCREV